MLIRDKYSHLLHIGELKVRNSAFLKTIKQALTHTYTVFWCFIGTFLKKKKSFSQWLNRIIVSKYW